MSCPSSFPFSFLPSPSYLFLLLCFLFFNLPDIFLTAGEAVLSIFFKKHEKCGLGCKESFYFLLVSMSESSFVNHIYLR